MATIGTFKPTATGFEGTIATLMTNKKVRFVANGKKEDREQSGLLRKIRSL